MRDVGALPVDLVAGGTINEFFLCLEHKRRNAVLYVGLEDGVETRIAQQAARKEVFGRESQLQLSDELPELFEPVVASDEDAGRRPGLLGNAGVTGEEDSLLFGGFSDKLAVVYFPKVKGIVAEDAEPAGELAQLVIEDEGGGQWLVELAGLFGDSFSVHDVNALG